MMSNATSRLHQDMRDMWNEISVPKLVNEAKKKQVIQEIRNDDLDS